MRHILHFLAEPFFRLTRKKRLGNPPKVAKVMAKYTNELEFIDILQYHLTHLRLEIIF